MGSARLLECSLTEWVHPSQTLGWEQAWDGGGGGEGRVSSLSRWLDHPPTRGLTSQFAPQPWSMVVSRHPGSLPVRKSAGSCREFRRF